MTMVFLRGKLDSDFSKKGTEVGALVASLNATFTKYCSTCIFSSSNEDVIKGMGPAVAKAIRRYREANGRIIMYRDRLGVLFSQELRSYQGPDK